MIPSRAKIDQHVQQRQLEATRQSKWSKLYHVIKRRQTTVLHVIKDEVLVKLSFLVNISGGTGILYPHVQHTHHGHVS